MQKLVVLSSLALLLFVACGKDKYETTPHIEIKSIEPGTVGINQPLTVELEYTDKEGDIADSIFIRKVRINQKKLKTLRDSFWLQLPGDAPDKNKGTIKLTLDYNSYLTSAENPGNPPNAAPDSLIFRFILQDKGKHRSDSVESGLIIILRQP